MRMRVLSKDNQLRKDHIPAEHLAADARRLVTLRLTAVEGAEHVAKFVGQEINLLVPRVLANHLGHRARQKNCSRIIGQINGQK